MKERQVIQLTLEPIDVAILKVFEEDLWMTVETKDLNERVQAQLPCSEYGIMGALLQMHIHKMVTTDDLFVNWRVTNKGRQLLHEYETDSLNHSSM